MRLLRQHFAKVVLLVIAYLGSSSGLHAQTYQTWRGENEGANNGNLLNGSAWWNFPNNSTMVFGQQEFDNNTRLVMTNNNGGSTFNTWRWLFKANASSARTITGDALRFNDFSGQDGGIYNESGATHIFNNAIEGDGAGDPFQIHLNSTGGLTFGSTVNNQGTAIEILGSASGAKTVTFTGVVSGSGGMYVNNGNSTVLFDAANTQSGQLTINAGTVKLNNSGDTFGSSSQAIRVGSGATLDLNGVSTTAGSVGEEGAGDGGTISLGGGTLTISGSSSTSQNSISGSGGITHSGSGTLALYNAQTYTGTTSVSAGTVSTSGAMSSTAYSITGTGTFRTTTTAERISDTASITLGGGTLSLGANEAFGNNGVTLNTSTSSSVSVDSGVTASVSGALSGSGTLVKSGAGQFNLSGNSTSFTGAVTVSAGSLEVQSANALGSTAVGTTVNSGAELRLWHSTGVTVAAEGLNLNGTGIGSAGALRNINANNTWQGAITLQSASRVNSDSGRLTLDVASGDGIAGAHNLTFGGAGDITVSDRIATSTGTLTKDGSGILTLSGNNTYSGETLLNNGTILVGNNGAFGTGTMTINHDGGTGTRTLASFSGSGFTLNNNFNLYFNSFTLGQASGGTGSLTLGGAGKTFFLGNDNTTQNRVITVNGNHEIAAAVTGGNNNHLVKQGSGELALSGENTSTGNIYIDSGTIHLKGGSLSSGSIEIGGGVANNAVNSDNATLKVTSGSFSRSVIINSETTTGGTSGTRNINFANSTGTATLSGSVSMEKGTEVSVGTSGAEGVLSGAISGNGGLTKTGLGTLTLSGANANSYTGSTTVNGGTLKLHKTTGNAIASGAGNTIAIQQGTLLLGAASQIGDSTAINMSSGTTLDTAGFSDQVGQLRFTGSGVNVTIKGLAAGDNGSFIFSDLETASIGKLATASGGVGGLTFSGSGYDFTNGFKIKLFSTDISSTLTSNNFSTKISFEGASQVGAISFSGGSSTYLNVAAIPEPKVYVAAGALALLIGCAEVRRRKRAKSAV